MAALRFKLAIYILLYATHCNGKVMRNNALMNKMVSHFQGNNNNDHNNEIKSEHGNEKHRQIMNDDNSRHHNKEVDDNNRHHNKEFQSPHMNEGRFYNTNDKRSYQSKVDRKPNNGERDESTGNVMAIMQTVLCKNFPSIPCKMIVEDSTLKNLIEKSIQQMKYKRLSLEKTPSTVGYQLTLFPTVNSEDLSNFLAVRDNLDFHKKRKYKTKLRNWSHEKQTKQNKKMKKDSKRATVYTSRKKIRKFYPHKVKYKDKTGKNYADTSEEKSVSIENPDTSQTGKHQRLRYKAEPADPLVWRIDYMKHGEPSLNMLGYGRDSLQSKLMDAGPNVIVDENLLEQGARKDVLHPDVYIKKTFGKRSNIKVNSAE